jgi:hypothetical protein
MKNLILLLLAGASVVVVALAGAPILERHRRVSEMQTLWATLDQARYSADSCKVALAREEETFFRFDRRVDSLRNVVEAYEDPVQGGVPEAEYLEYLKRFDQYNDLVEDWQIRADSLQAEEARCRELVETHNALADSIQTIREERRATQEGMPEGSS